MFHVKRALPLLLLAACTDPVSLDAPGGHLEPEAVSDNVVRLTRNLGADAPRGVLSDGRVLYLGQNLPGFGDGWGLYAWDPVERVSSEVMRPFRRALPRDRLTGLSEDAAGLVLLSEVGVREVIEFCGGVSPKPVAGALRVIAVDPATSTPLSAQRPLLVPSVFTRDVDGLGNWYITFRRTPAYAEAAGPLANPWGPIILPDGSIVVSDGEVLWHYPRAGGAPDSLTTGAYPVAGPDGHLYFSRPVISDSTAQVDQVGLGLTFCRQTTWDYVVDGWTLWRWDPASGVETAVAEGRGATFLDEATAVLRRDDGLYVVNLSNGEASLLIAGTEASVPVALADTAVVFSELRNGNRDLFLVRR